MKQQRQCAASSAAACFDRTYEELKLGAGGFAFEAFLRFDRTYEELKPDMIFTDPPYNVGFDRTYEELKHVRTGSSTGDPCGSFDRTYEELKLGPALSAICLKEQVLIVPMRN